MKDSMDRTVSLWESKFSQVISRYTFKCWRKRHLKLANNNQFAEGGNDISRFPREQTGGIRVAIGSRWSCKPWNIRSYLFGVKAITVRLVTFVSLTNNLFRRKIESCFWFTQELKQRMSEFLFFVQEPNWSFQDWTFICNRVRSC